MNLLKWFGRRAEILQAAGTEQDPILRGSRDHSPTKYQCVQCHRWIVEPEVDLMLRDKGRGLDTGGWWYQPICEDCARENRHESWERAKAEARQEWTHYE